MIQAIIEGSRNRAGIEGRADSIKALKAILKDVNSWDAVIIGVCLSQMIP